MMAQPTFDAGAFKAKLEAKEKGHTEVLWTNNGIISEAGTMNLFFLRGNKLITPKLDGTILPGVTRASIIELAKQQRSIRVSEMEYPIERLIEDIENNKINEIFGTGTAAVVTSIDSIEHNNKKYSINNQKTFSSQLYNLLLEIQHGIYPYGSWVDRIGL